MSRYTVEIISEFDEVIHDEVIHDEVMHDEAMQWMAPLQAAAEATLSHEHVPFPAGLTILLTNDTRLHELNLAFRGEDKPTDVLSFALEGPAGPELAGYRGDIAISVETAARQAHTAGHPLLDELRLLTVHGVLHLLGYDHDEPAEEATMWARQNDILRSLNDDSN